ncbi:uncharacterized protein KNAG_0K00490 [Huiozyma naganishii CBS 8797]|uniref:6-phosphogluconolactonase n=1 Tax=Huiozyma naganishii (strain ATCC MYA-139 / BCRC 22969 / CBS 8797 / KCTC 17520 / NBRC 10181 / NCYC 3082 / Yp74L-3) TaxID=1071383 RepID=J7S347_HUIN7|nr:hypothetical protein KNAG_0K00490 [Kazachstania naganishii CBS 8797]CCK72417.1 hypothetical protein KNAG_0K00490 [Kazachstania naganishii CBS 8797]
MSATGRYPESELSHELCSLIVDKQNEALETTGEFNVALDIADDNDLCSTLVQGLVDDPQLSSQVQWSKWKIYFVREKLVPFDSPDSHYGMFKAQILNRLIHKGGHLNLGPTVVTINESLVTAGDKEGVDTDKIVSEFQSLLPKDKFDLVVLTGTVFVDRDASDTLVVGPDNQVHLNMPVLRAAHHVCFFLLNNVEQKVLSPSGYELVETQCPDRMSFIMGDNVSLF